MQYMWHEPAPTVDLQPSCLSRQPMLSVYVCAGPVHLSEPVAIALKGIYIPSMTKCPSMNTSSLLLSIGRMCMPFKATHHWLRELQRPCTQNQTAFAHGRDASALE